MSNEMVGNRANIRVDEVIACYELLGGVVQAMGKHARTLVELTLENENASKVVDVRAIKTFLLPGDVTDWRPASVGERSNLPNGMVINHQRVYGAGLTEFIKSDGEGMFSDKEALPYKKLVVDEMDSVRYSRPKEAGGEEQYHTLQKRYRLMWDDTSHIVRTAEVRRADIYSSPQLLDWSVAGLLREKDDCDTTVEPFRVEEAGWQKMTSADIEILMHNIDTFHSAAIQDKRAE